MPERIMRVVPLHTSVGLVGVENSAATVEALQQAADEANLDIKISASDLPLAQVESPAPGEYILCGYRKLIDFLRDAELEDSRSFSDLLDEWLDECRQVLAFCQKSRRQVALVDLSTLASRPKQVLSKALERLGVDEDKIEALEAHEEDQEELSADPILAILVEAATRTSPSVRQVAEQIEAQSLISIAGLSNRRNVHLEDAFFAYRQGSASGDEGMEDEPDAVAENDELAEQLRTVVAGLQAENFLYREQESLLRTELETLSSLHRKALLEVEHRSKELAQARKTSSEFEGQANDLKVRLQERDAEVSKLQAELQAHVSRISGLEDEAARLVGQNALMEQSLNALEQERDAVSEERDALQADCVSLTQKVEGLQEREAALEQSESELRQQNESLVEDKVVLSAQNAHLTQERDSLKHKIDVLGTEIAAATRLLESSSVSPEGSTVAGDSLVSRLESYLDSLELKLMQVQSEKHAAVKAGAQVEALASQRDEEAQQLRKQQAAAQTEIAALKGDIEAIRASTSWRVTQPIRSVTSWVVKKPK